MEIPCLTIGESKVYETLVELGESSIGGIIKVSGVSSSKIYEILKRLSKKGLVSSINKNGKQYFSPSNPEMLKELLEGEKNKLKEMDVLMEGIIKNLKSRRNISKTVSVLNAFEGIKGMKAVLDSILENLNSRQEILILGSPKAIGENAGGYLKEWQKRRMKIGAICKIITDADTPSWNEQWWEEGKNKKITFTKKSKSISPSYLVITDNTVVTIYFSTEILSFLINHKDIASRYKSFFNELWKSL